MFKNKLSLLVISLVVLSLLSVGVVAQETASPAPNLINPGWGFLYKWDIYFDNQRLLAAPPGIAKARVAIEIANERLAEMKAVGKDADLVVVADQGRDMALTAVAEQDLNTVEKQETETRLNNHIEALTTVIQRFKEDDNPNNDNAIDSLQRALDRTQNRRTDIWNKVTTEVNSRAATKELKAVDETCFDNTDCDSGSCKTDGGTLRCSPTAKTARDILATDNSKKGIYN